MSRSVRRALATLDDTDAPLLLAVGGLCLCGMLAVFGAGSYRPEALLQTGDQSLYLVKHAIRLALGLGALVMAASIDYRRLRRPAVIWGMLAVGLVLVAVPVLLGGNQINRWIAFFGLFPVQPLELAKIAVVIFLADRFCRTARVADSSRREVMLALGCGPLALVAILLLQPNYGSALVIAATTLILLFVAGAKLRWLALLAGLTAVAAAGGYFVVSKLHTRVNAWWSGLRFDDYGYQVDQSLIGLGAGGWLGLGIGNSHNKFAFLPESHTDFVFAILGEELGLLGTLLILCLFVAVAWRGITIAQRAADRFGRLLAYGLTALIFVYAVANMAMVVGLVPVVGIPLPFVSYGGSALVTNLAAIGILLSIDRRGREYLRWRQRWRRN